MSTFKTLTTVSLISLTLNSCVFFKGKGCNTCPAFSQINASPSPYLNPDSDELFCDIKK